MKVIAKIKNGEEIIEVGIQQMFPNCRIRYTKCCKDDKGFWDKYQKRAKELEYKLQPFRPEKRNNAPEGFETIEENKELKKEFGGIKVNKNGRETSTT